MDIPEHTIELAEHLRGIAEEAARGVGPLLREAFRTGTETVQKTNAHDLVTAFDQASERAIAAHLFAAHPDSRILGEEGGHQGHGSIEWIVDPIDGTSNFAHGVAFFCVSIAAALDGELLAGVIYDPIAELMFSANAEGAWLNDRRLEPQGTAEETSSSLMTDYPSAEAIELDGPAALEDFATLVTRYATVRRTVSGALGLAHVAAGWTDVALGFDTNPWDVAAGVLLVRRTGGSYLPYSYDDEVRPAHEAPVYIATGPRTCAATAIGIVEQRVAARRAVGHRR